MRFLLLTFAALCLAAIPARADIAPPYPEFTAGLSIEDAQPYPKVSAVDAGSPAGKAGVKIGDFVLALNGAYAKSPAPFYFWAKGLRGPKNSKMQVVLLRGDSQVLVVSLTRTLGRR